MCLFMPPHLQLIRSVVTAQNSQTQSGQMVTPALFPALSLLKFISLISLSYILHLHSYFRHLAGAFIWSNLEWKEQKHHIMFKLLQWWTLWSSGCRTPFTTRDIKISMIMTLKNIFEVFFILVGVSAGHFRSFHNGLQAFSWQWIFMATLQQVFWPGLSILLMTQTHSDRQSESVRGLVWQSGL